MKLPNNFFGLILFVFCIFSSCNKDEGITETPCVFEIVVEPICSFNPKNAQTVAFPVKISSDGVYIIHPDYEFDWSLDPNFHGSAISTTYEQLPLTVTVTEVATGCTAEATLENTYWD